MDSTPVANGGPEALEDGRAVDEEEGVVTIKEYVEDLEAQELEVDMILGGDDGKECTYPKGYLPRQAVFSCITCCPDVAAGVCTACSMNCHDGHEIIEIWTRRHFRCDCGNSKFGIGACKLFSSKDSENDENVYNKNYKGVYCACNRPYPDPEAVEDMGEMLQCCVCEDWFHEAHLGLASTEEVPRDEEGEPSFEEVICQACAASLEFLSHYRSLMLPINSSISSHKEEMPAEMLSIDAARVELGEANGMAGSYGAIDERVELGEANGISGSNGTINEKVEVGELNGMVHDSSQITENVPLRETHTVLQSGSLEHESMNQNSANGGVIYSNGNDKNKVECSNTCEPCKLLCGQAWGSATEVSLGNGTTGPSTLSSGWTDKALFLTKNWRSQLCRCNACMELYAEKRVSFLIELNDTIAKYEEVAKEKRKEKMDASSGQDLSFLNGMSHVGKIEFLHGLNDMTSELSAFFASCESGKAITSADIYEVFENLKKKRARLE